MPPLQGWDLIKYFFMLDLTVIILTYNEEIHIRRCLENVCPIAKKVIVVDSPSTDRTQEIVKEFNNTEVVVHKYPGNQAEQFNWALDNLKIETEWILRLDADEYLMPELVEELKEKLPKIDKDKVSAGGFRDNAHGCGASTRGFASHKQIMRDHQLAFKRNGVYSNVIMECMRYVYKIYEKLGIAAQTECRAKLA